MDILYKKKYLKYKKKYLDLKLLYNINDLKGGLYDINQGVGHFFESKATSHKPIKKSTQQPKFRQAESTSIYQDIEPSNFLNVTVDKSQQPNVQTNTELESQRVQLSKVQTNPDLESSRVQTNTELESPRIQLSKVQTNTELESPQVQLSKVHINTFQKEQTNTELESPQVQLSKIQTNTDLESPQVQLSKIQTNTELESPQVQLSKIQTNTDLESPQVQLSKIQTNTDLESPRVQTKSYVELHQELQTNEHFIHSEQLSNPHSFNLSHSQKKPMLQHKIVTRTTQSISTNFTYESLISYIKEVQLIMNKTYVEILNDIYSEEIQESNSGTFRGNYYFKFKKDTEFKKNKNISTKKSDNQSNVFWLLADHNAITETIILEFTIRLKINFPHICYIIEYEPYNEDESDESNNNKVTNDESIEIAYIEAVINAIGKNFMTLTDSPNLKPIIIRAFTRKQYINN